VAPRTITEPVELVDVLPTLLASSGVRSPRGIDGQSFLSIVLRNVRGREYLFAQTTFGESPTSPSSGAKRMLLAPGEWQVVHDPVRETVEFYELHDDPRALEPLQDLEGIEVPPVLHRLLGH
jgi:arylsulfatase A-like enzyme